MAAKAPLACASTCLSTPCGDSDPAQVISGAKITISYVLLESSGLEEVCTPPPSRAKRLDGAPFHLRHLVQTPLIYL